MIFQQLAASCIIKGEDRVLEQDPGCQPLFFFGLSVLSPIFSMTFCQLSMVYPFFLIVFINFTKIFVVFIVFSAAFNLRGFY